MENLFRRFKGKVVDVKTVSGEDYAGRITEITNDYVCLTESATAPGQQVFLLYGAIESVVVSVKDS